MLVRQRRHRAIGAVALQRIAGGYIVLSPGIDDLYAACILRQIGNRLCPIVLRVQRHGIDLRRTVHQLHRQTRRTLAVLVVVVVPDLLDRRFCRLRGKGIRHRQAVLPVIQNRGNGQIPGACVFGHRDDRIFRRAVVGDSVQYEAAGDLLFRRRVLPGHVVGVLRAVRNGLGDGIVICTFFSIGDVAERRLCAVLRGLGFRGGRSGHRSGIVGRGRRHRALALEREREILVAGIRIAGDQLGDLQPGGYGRLGVGIGHGQTGFVGVVLHRLDTQFSSAGVLDDDHRRGMRRAVVGDAALHEAARRLLVRAGGSPGRAVPILRVIRHVLSDAVGISARFAELDRVEGRGSVVRRAGRNHAGGRHRNRGDRIRAVHSADRRQREGILRRQLFGRQFIGGVDHLLDFQAGRGLADVLDLGRCGFIVDDGTLLAGDVPRHHAVRRLFLHHVVQVLGNIVDGPGPVAADLDAGGHALREGHAVIDRVDVRRHCAVPVQGDGEAVLGARVRGNVADDRLFDLQVALLLIVLDLQGVIVGIPVMNPVRRPVRGDHERVRIGINHSIALGYSAFHLRQGILRVEIQGERALCAIGIDALDSHLAVGIGLKGALGHVLRQGSACVADIAPIAYAQYELDVRQPDLVVVAVYLQKPQLDAVTATGDFAAEVHVLLLGLGLIRPRRLG